MKHVFITSLKASGIHFLCSLLLISILIGSLIAWFFPYPFIAIDDIGTALVILLAVDLTLGPLLTLLLYKPGKKGLLLDMVCIIALQLAALAYGSWAIYDSRPAYLVFYGDAFYLADHKRIDQSQLIDNTLAVGAFSRPKVVAAVLPGTASERMALAMDSMGKGVPVHFNAQYLKPFQTIEPAQLLLLALNAQRIPNIPEIYHDKNRYAVFNLVNHQFSSFVIVDIHNMAITDIIHSQ